MEFYSDEDEGNGFGNPCYAAYDAVGERMCKAFKEQRFHNDPEHLLAPSMKRALQAYDRALNELSYGLNIHLSGCCYRRSNSSHCFQRTNEQNFSCRNHDEYSRLVEVVDVGSSTVDIDVPDGEKIVKTLNTNTSDEETRISSILPQEGIDNISDKTLLMTPSPPLSWRVEKTTEKEMEVGQSVQICEETLNDFQIETSPIDQNLDVCEIPKSSEIAEKLSSTSENQVLSARETRATCHRELCEDGKKRDTDRNININVKVKIHRRKKESINQDNVNEPKESKGKPKGQEENKKHGKKLPKCEITKPIIVCNKSPESGMKFFKFFKCKKINKKPTDEAGKFCTCEGDQERKSNPKTPSSTMHIFNTTIRSLGSDIISTKQLTPSIVGGKNGHKSEERSRLSGKNSSQNHRTSGSGAQLSKGAESNQIEKAGLQKMSRSKRSVAKTQSERSSGLLKDHDKPDTSRKKGQIGNKKESKQREQKLKNDKPKLSSHPEQKKHASKSNHKNSNVKRYENNKHEKVSSNVYEHGAVLQI
ncbi:hypothetical protein JTB14_035417 [Gonioctena quinquepunctata]|nr:hypothetical protein JTB14_035417 [Gonioctena quinquepunctata]